MGRSRQGVEQSGGRRVALDDDQADAKDRRVSKILYFPIFVMKKVCLVK